MAPPFISERAMDTRCCWPPDSWLGRFAVRSPSPSVSSSTRARAVRVSEVHACVDRWQRDVLGGAQVLHQVVALEDRAKVLATQARQVIRRHLLPVAAPSTW